MKKGVLIIIVLVIFSCLVFGDSSTGTFDVSNVAPPSPFDWQPITTHNKYQNFTWNESIDQNGDEIYTYVCITNDTDSDSCSVVSDFYTNDPSYTFNQSEPNWDYAPFGTASRTYYVRLTPYDLQINGTANDTISYTLTDAVPTLGDESSPNGGNICDVDYDEMTTLSFSAVVSDSDSDNSSFKICSTDSIDGTTGSCVVLEACNASGYNATTSKACINTVLTNPATGAQQTAYGFVCDCVGNDTTCPSQCNPSGTAITYYVNQQPGDPSGTAVAGGTSGTTAVTCSASDVAGYGTGDTGNAGSGSIMYYWTGGSGDNCGGSSTDTCASANFRACELITCNTYLQDDCSEYGPGEDLDSMTIANTAPVIQGLWVQNTVTEWTILDNANITHDDTPQFKVQVYDSDIPDGANQNMTIRVNVSSVGIGGYDFGSYYGYMTANGNVSISATTNLLYDGNSSLYYLSVELWDNATCGDNVATMTDYELSLVNAIPYLDSINVSAIHDNTPEIEFVINDLDDGASVSYWPADTEWEYTASVFDAVNGSVYCTFSGTSASKTVETGTCNSIPWGTDLDSDFSNRTLTFRLLVQDRFTGEENHTHGSDAYAVDSIALNQNFTLYDYLPNVQDVSMTDAGAYSSCTLSSCALTPVAGGNTTVSVMINVTDLDGDCASTVTTNFYLCINETKCNSTMSEFNWNVDNVTQDGNDCMYTFTSNKTASDVTPEFWRAPSTGYYFYVETTSSSGLEMITDSERSDVWTYNGIQSIDYNDTIYLGSGTLDLGQWNNGTSLATAVNYGNVILNLSWQSTDPTSGSDTWYLNDTDLMIDDDVLLNSDAVLSSVYVNGTEAMFFPTTGLARCLSDGCNSGSVDETLDTYFHAAPPEGLTAGTYNSTLTITLYNYE